MIIHVILQTFYLLLRARSRIENFVTKVNDFRPLVIVTGDSVSYVAWVLDLPEIVKVFVSVLHFHMQFQSFYYVFFVLIYICNKLLFFGR